MKYSNIRCYKFKKLVSRSAFDKVRHADINEFSDFLLQLKKQRSGRKTVCGFSIIILKGVMTL